MVDCAPVAVAKNPVERYRVGAKLPDASPKVRELMLSAGLPGDGDEVDLLGRISQLVEELPWLAELRAGLTPARPGAPACLATGARATFVRPS